MTHKLNERERWLLERLHASRAAASPLEYVSADSVVGSGMRREDTHPADRLTSQGAGQILSRLAKQGYCEREFDGMQWRYRRLVPVGADE